MQLGVVSDVDGFAMTMVLILVLSFGVVALLLVSIFRSGKRRHDPVEDLIDEVRREDDARKMPASTAAPQQREPWEKEADWWKK